MLRQMIQIWGEAMLLGTGHCSCCISHRHCHGLSSLSRLTSSRTDLICIVLGFIWQHMAGRNHVQWLLLRAYAVKWFSREKSYRAPLMQRDPWQPMEDGLIERPAFVHGCPLYLSICASSGSGLRRIEQSGEKVTRKAAFFLNISAAFRELIDVNSKGPEPEAIRLIDDGLRIWFKTSLRWSSYQLPPLHKDAITRQQRCTKGLLTYKCRANDVMIV